MDLSRLLEMCRRDQWQVGDLDWTRAPRPMDRATEEAVVQYFTDMAGIERLAGALFLEQGRRAKDPVAQEIFRYCYIDELSLTVEDLVVLRLERSLLARQTSELDPWSLRELEPDPTIVRVGSLLDVRYETRGREHVEHRLSRS